MFRIIDNNRFLPTKELENKENQLPFLTLLSKVFFKGEKLDQTRWKIERAGFISILICLPISVSEFFSIFCVCVEVVEVDS